MRLPIRTLVVYALLLSLWPLHAGERNPRRVDDALRLLAQLKPEDNRYVFGGNVVDFDSPAMKADCSGFLNALLMHSDGFDAARIRKVFGSTRPTAKRYYDAILEGKAFETIGKVEDTRAGDILAVAYLKNYTGKATGHVMLAAGPARRMDERGPVLAGTMQWEVPVIDSAINGHGPADPRRGKGEGGASRTGIGKGVLRVYADEKSAPAGYTWGPSNADRAAFYPQGDRPLAIGRLRAAER